MVKSSCHKKIIIKLAKQKKFLVTTAIECAFPDKNCSTLLLGEWCRLYIKKDYWHEKNIEVLSYHWNDRIKLFNDYKYLINLHERLLSEIALKLNEIHEVNYSVRYWRILVGPWLGYFVPMLFDRWTCIKNAVDQYDISETKIISFDTSAMTPNDMSHFQKLYVNDPWNHHIYSLIASNFFKIKCIKIESIVSIQNINNDLITSRNTISKLKYFLSNFYENLMKFFVRPSDIFLISTYLTKTKNFFLQIKLGQIPQINNIPSIAIASEINWNKRKWILPVNNDNDFEKFVKWLIPQQIPISYIEGYKLMVERSNNFNWPNRPKLIWTSNEHIINDIFKVWAANQILKGTKLIIGQHGGHFGIGKWNFIEEHDFAISDKYLTWGWSVSANKNIIPVGQLNAKCSRNRYSYKNQNVLLVMNAMPRYSYWMFSSTISSKQFDDYVENCFLFTESLTKKIREVLTVRLLKHDFNCYQKERWQDRCPDIRLDFGSSNMEKLMNECRLFISTYNATTFLESFSQNIPTVIFWDEEHWEIRDSAIPYFEKLKEVKIFHVNAKSAADHINQVWDDVIAWWGSEIVQEVRKEFCYNYAHNPSNLSKKIESVLVNIIHKND